MFNGLDYSMSLNMSMAFFHYPFRTSPRFVPVSSLSTGLRPDRPRNTVANAATARQIQLSRKACFCGVDFGLLRP